MRQSISNKNKSNYFFHFYPKDNKINIIVKILKMKCNKKYSLKLKEAFLKFFK